MQERIQKIISAAGVTSRRAAELLIAEGRVRVNGQVVTELGTKADPGKDHIKVDGKLINPKQPPTYILLNKPAGFVTTMSDPEGRPTVQDLIKTIKVRVYPVGRLDYNTEGLLLLTNDGDFAHLITHPKHEFPKTYLAKIKGVLGDSGIEALEQGVFLKDGKTAPAKIKKIRKEEANSWLEITIHEGRKRQVRRMFDHMGHTVIKLKRVRVGTLTLGDLPEGSSRYLSPAEVQTLREDAQKTDVTTTPVRRRVKSVEAAEQKDMPRKTRPVSKTVEIIDLKKAHKGKKPDLRPWRRTEQARPGSDETKGVRGTTRFTRPETRDQASSARPRRSEPFREAGGRSSFPTSRTGSETASRPRYSKPSETATASRRSVDSKRSEAGSFGAHPRRNATAPRETGEKRYPKSRTGSKPAPMQRYSKSSEPSGSGTRRPDNKRSGGFGSRPGGATGGRKFTPKSKPGRSFS